MRTLAPTKEARGTCAGSVSLGGLGGCRDDPRVGREAEIIVGGKVVEGPVVEVHFCASDFAGDAEAPPQVAVVQGSE